MNINIILLARQGDKLKADGEFIEKIRLYLQ